MNSLKNSSKNSALIGRESEALKNLENAIEFDNQFKDKAKDDVDFNNIKDLDEFKKLIS